MKKILSVILIISILIMSLVSCGSTPADTANSQTTPPSEVSNDLGLLEPGVLNAATNPEYPPFEYLEGNEIVGFDIELLNEVAKISGLEVRYTPMEFSTIISAVQSGQFDIGMSAFSKTPEREQLALFSDPYYESSQVALLPANSTFKTVEEINGKKLGADLGTTGETAAKTLSDDVTTVSTTVAFPMLKSGQLDAYICDIGVAKNAVATGEFIMIETPISSESVSMLFNINNVALRDELNKSLKIFMETPEYNALVEKYGLN